MRSLKRHWASIAAGVLVLSVGAALAQTFLAPRPDEDGCPTTGATEHIAILVDSSEPLHEAQRDELGARILSLLRGAGPTTRLSILTLGGGDEPDLVPEFSVCNAANTPYAGGVWKNEKLREVIAELEADLKELEAKERPTTPLVQGIETLRYRRDVITAPTRLFVVSDFLQNTSDWSHYPGTPGYRRPSPKVLPPLGEQGATFAEATLMLLQRPNARALQTRAHEAFWLAYFARISKTAPQLEKL